jgi:hypothetical protein
MFDEDILERDDGGVVVDWPVVVEPDAPGIDEPVVDDPVVDEEPVMDGLASLAPDRSEAEPLVPVVEPPRCASLAPEVEGEAVLGAEVPAPELEPAPEPLVWASAGAASKVVASR